MNEREVLTNLEKAIQRKNHREAKRLVREAIQANELDAWRLLLMLASSQTAANDRETLVAVRALRDNYLDHKHPLYAEHAAVLLATYRVEPGASVQGIPV